MSKSLLSRGQSRIRRMFKMGAPANRPGQTWLGMEPLETRTLLSADPGFLLTLGSDLNDSVESVATDAAGNIYAAGYFTGEVDFDPSEGVSTLISPTNEVTSGKGNKQKTETVHIADTFLAKYSPTGEFIWAVQTNKRVYIDDIGVHGNGVYIGGLGALTLDTAEGQTTIDNGAYAASVDGATGAFQWLRRIGGGSSTAQGYVQIDVDSQENLLIGFDFTGSGEFVDPVAGTTTLTALGTAPWGRASDNRISQGVAGASPPFLRALAPLPERFSLVLSR